MFQCARNGYTEEVRTLLKDPHVLADINNVDEEHQAALHYAARYNHYEIVKLLVEHKAGTYIAIQGTNFSASGILISRSA